MPSKLLAVALAASSAWGGTVPAPNALPPLPTGAVTPTGWFLKQLELQADGLTGHLALFWEDVMDSVWVGGAGDTGLHERTPYWMNGLVPLAFLLENADGANVRAGKKGTLCAQEPRRRKAVFSYMVHRDPQRWRVLVRGESGSATMA